MARSSSAVSSALLSGLSALTLSNAHKEYLVKESNAHKEYSLRSSNAYKEYSIRVRNLTYMQPFSPVLFVAHKNDISIFKEGLEASDALKALAEDGDASELEALLATDDVSPYVCGYVLGSAVHMPGETERYTLTVDTDLCEGSTYISMASMAVNTNDGFVGFDSETLKSSGTSKFNPPVWDAGTEDNNELCTHIPGPACDGSSGNEEDGPGEGYVHTHRGIHGVSGELYSHEYTWLNPAAEVYIANPTSSSSGQWD